MPSVSRQSRPIKNAHSVLYLEVQNYIYIYIYAFFNGVYLYMKLSGHNKTQ